jgi:hypothetical protein
MNKLRISQPLKADPVIEAYKRDVDRSLLRERLQLTHEQRLLDLEAFINDLDALRAARRVS